MATTNLAARVAALQASTQPSPAPTDPVVVTSQVGQALATFEQSLPTSDTGLPVGAWWSNGGIPTRVKVAS
jgi:hypothetical protein